MHTHTLRQKQIHIKPKNEAEKTTTKNINVYSVHAYWQTKNLPNVLEYTHQPNETRSLVTWRLSRSGQEHETSNNWQVSERIQHFMRLYRAHTTLDRCVASNIFSFMSFRFAQGDPPLLIYECSVIILLSHFSCFFSSFIHSMVQQTDIDVICIMMMMLLLLLAAKKEMR